MTPPIHPRYRDHRFIWDATVTEGGYRILTYLCPCGKVKEKREKTGPRKKPLQRVPKPKPAQTTPKPLKPARTPQNAKKRPLRKTRLKPMSDDKRDWTALYLEKIDRDTLYGVFYDLGEKDGEPVVVRKVGSRLWCERHHPAARHKYHIILYRFCSMKLHEYIHAHGRWSRQVGTLLPQFEGRESSDDQPDPLEALSELRELQSKY